MAWPNQYLTVYHGTDSRSAYDIVNNGINPRYFNPQADFGRGFYVTTYLHQAKNWANDRTRVYGGSGSEVLTFKLDRAVLETLAQLTFVTDTQDFHDLVDYCWKGGPDHGPNGKVYDAIYGPVSLHPQTLVIGGCDQICFPDPSKLAGFGSPTTTQAFPNRFF